MQYILLLYHYDANAILLKTLRNSSDAEMLKAYDDLYNYLDDIGLSPCLNILDHEVSTTVKWLLLKRNTKFQLMDAHNHRVNAAERAIRKFKNRFIAGLCIIDTNFPIQKWDRMIKQAPLTMNLLHISRLNPRLSSEAKINSVFDYNNTPLVATGTKALIFEDPNICTLWDPHGVDAWFVGHSR